MRFKFRALDIWLILFAYCTVLLLSGIEIFWNLDIEKYDLAGHLASAQDFWNVGFHRFNDRMFLGNIQNLFYPPLEDFLLGAFLKLPFDQINLFKAYLFILVLGTLTSYYFMILELAPKSKIALVSHILFLGFFLVAKIDLSNFQGLSLFDLTQVGLSSQILGLIWFLNWIRLANRSERGFWSYVCLVASFLSHITFFIVLNLFLLLSVFQFGIQCRGKINDIFRSTNFNQLIIGNLLCLFFWGPFIYYSNLISSASLFGNFKLELLILCLLSVLAIVGQFRIIGILTVLLYLPTTLGHYFPVLKSYIKDFHYYRFESIILLVQLIIFSLVPWAEIKAKKFLNFVRIAYAATMVVVFLNHILPNLNFVSYQAAQTDLDKENLNIPRDFLTEQRALFIGSSRAIDFGQESLFRIYNSELRTTKGLFWESHGSNLIISSYLSSIFSSHGMLNFKYLEAKDCGMRACLLENAIRDYAVTSIVTNSHWNSNYINPEAHTCIESALALGTDSFDFQSHPLIGNSENRFTEFRVRSKSATGFRSLKNSMIESVEVSQLAFVAQRKDLAISHINHRYSQCLVRDYSFKIHLLEKDKPNIEAAIAKLQSASANPIKFRKIANSYFEINPESTVPQLFFIKLAYLPGITAVDEKNEPLPTFESSSGVLVSAAGDFKIIYGRTHIMWISYLVSMLALLTILFLIRAHRRT